MNQCHGRVLVCMAHKTGERVGYILVRVFRDILVSCIAYLADTVLQMWHVVLAAHLFPVIANLLEHVLVELLEPVIADLLFSVREKLLERTLGELLERTLGERLERTLGER